MTAEELLAKIQRGEIPTREELEAFSASQPQKYRVRRRDRVVSAARAQSDAVFEVYSKGRVGWRHVYSWYIVAYDPVERQISTELHSIGPLGRADLND
jgi:hypothetical protein